MSLLRITPTASTPLSTNAQATFQSELPANTAWFTVPIGRVYVGYFSNTTSRNTTLINGVEIRAWGGGGAGTSAQTSDGGGAMPYTLIAGTVVSEGSVGYSSRFVGVSYPA